MKKGERIAMGFVAAMVVVVGVLTAYMEMHRRSSGGSTANVVAGASGGDVQAARLIPPGVRPDDLPDAQSRGARSLALYCGQCHDLPPPTMHTPEEWFAVLARMDVRMAAMAGGMLARLLRPAAAERAVLEDYLASHALKALDPQRLASLDAPTGQALRTACAGCHALPDPAQHGPDEWRLVVARMKQNMAQAGRPLPDDGTLAVVMGYLQGAAR